MEKTTISPDQYLQILKSYENTQFDIGVLQALDSLIQAHRSDVVSSFTDEQKCTELIILNNILNNNNNGDMIHDYYADMYNYIKGIFSTSPSPSICGLTSVYTFPHPDPGLASGPSSMTLSSASSMASVPPCDDSNPSVPLSCNVDPDDDSIDLSIIFNQFIQSSDFFQQYDSQFNFPSPENVYTETNMFELLNDYKNIINQSLKYLKIEFLILLLLKNNYKNAGYILNLNSLPLIPIDVGKDEGRSKRTQTMPYDPSKEETINQHINSLTTLSNQYKHEELLSF